MRLDQQSFDLVNRMNELLSLYPEIGDDEVLKADTFEGMGLNDALAIMVDLAAEADAMAEAIKTRIETLQGRKGRFERRREHIRSIIETLLTAADMKKLVLPTATLSLSYRKPAPMVADETMLPDEFCKFKRSADMTKIKAAFETNQDVPGVVWSNGRNVLSIRTS